ncbi:MAG: protein-L-isoaspartate O-methyltransferase [Pseudomonadota bacterium]
MTDFTTQRLNMVDSQIRPNDVTDVRILQAMLDVPREEFVAASLRPLAYMDDHLVVREALGLLPARALLSPMVFAKLIQFARIEPMDLVLDVGCTTGYSTAVLARLAESVVALEGDEALSERASEALSAHDVDNAAVVTGTLAQGCPEQGPYDVIVIEGSIPEVGAHWREQLREGGRLVTVVHAPGRAGVGRATRYTRRGDEMSYRVDFDAHAPALPGFEKPPVFAL